MKLNRFVSFLLLSICAAYSLPSGSLTSDPYPFTFYSRNDWGAKPAMDTRPVATPVPYVIIHHTYLPAACSTVEECSAGMRSMQDYHIISEHFGDIGYNFCVGSEGGAYEGRGWQVVGVHAGKANNFSIGICLIGDWRVELPPQKQLNTTRALISAGVQKGIISPDYKLIGHNQVMETECPGTTLLDHISTWENFYRGVFEYNSNKD